MKVNELKPVDHVNIVVEVINVEDERTYNLRFPNGEIFMCCKSSEEIGNFFDELEFPKVSTSKL